MMAMRVLAAVVGRVKLMVRLMMTVITVMNYVSEISKRYGNNDDYNDFGNNKINIKANNRNTINDKKKNNNSDVFDKTGKEVR